PLCLSTLSIIHPSILLSSYRYRFFVLMLVFFFFFFFFSSRRRHTRSKRDWSSDVCSSDLVIFKYAPLKDSTSRIWFKPSKCMRSYPLCVRCPSMMSSRGDSDFLTR